jgi:hypothetical protein
MVLIAAWMIQQYYSSHSQQDQTQYTIHHQSEDGMFIASIAF